ncbi:MAG TPA: hypothetical protein VK843_12440 [Planctomycetota bacterium]|nr:hypothetical protein [Planctomycetota bacterium]
MRAPVLHLVILAGILVTGCSKTAQEPQAPLKATPVTPLLDWASVTKRNVPAKAESTASAALEDPAPAKKTSSLARAASSVAATGRHALFARLPKDALLVLDLPDLKGLHSALELSGLGHMLSLPQVDEPLTQMREAWTRGLTQMRQESPELVAALDLLPELGGRMAVAITGLTAESLRASAVDLPIAVCIVYDAGAQADRVAQVMAPLLAATARDRRWLLEEKPFPAWGCEMGDARFLLDFERRGDVFEIRMGGRSAVTRELASARTRIESSSFLASRVATEASNVEALGATELAEIHLQLTSLWDAIRAGGNRADTRVLARTGLPQFYGASVAVGRTQKGLAEALTLHSPSGIDLVTHLLTGQPMDRTLARCVPAGLANAGLYSFDGTRVIADLCLILPSEAQSGLVRGLSEFKREFGVDLEKDLLANFGPTIAVGTSGLSFLDSDALEFPSFFFACQLVDAARAKRSLTSLLIASGCSPDLETDTLEGVEVTSLAIPMDETGPELELHWCIKDSVLLLATSNSLLRESIRGLGRKGTPNAGLARALASANPDCFSAGFSQGEQGTPDAITVGRRTSAGLELTSADGMAMQSTVFSLFTLGVASSVAIPKLMAERIDANERAVASSLVVINDAQLMARLGNYLDRDGDGRGEQLFLDELSGESPLRGSTLPISDPWVENKFEWVEPGIGKRNGFYFRVDLPSVDGHGACSVADLEAHPLAPEGEEPSCVVSAWPIDLSTGNAVFVFDSEGGLYSSDNRGERQQYVGDRSPPMGAHWTASGEPGEATRYVGRDGGIWLRLRSVGDPPGR